MYRVIFHGQYYFFQSSNHPLNLTGTFTANEVGGENNAWMSIQLLSHKLVSNTWSVELGVRNQLKSDMW